MNTLKLGFLRIFVVVIFLLNSVVHAQTVKVELPDGTTWKGELLSKVIVVYSKDAVSKTIEGELVNATKTYLKVGEDLVWIDTIVSITSTSENKNLWVQDGELVDKNGNPIDQEELFQEDSSIVVRLHNLLLKDQDARELDQEPEESTTVNIEKPKKDKTIVIPLEGIVGAIYPDDYLGESGWFDAQILIEIFKSAQRDKDNVTTIIFEIDSGGGYVTEEKRICDLIQEYRGEFEFVAYPHDAFGAASTIVMTCDRLIASPDSKVGAAVLIDGSGQAVGEKYESADASVLRMYFANGNKPTEISAAFSILEAELWYNKTQNKFAAIKPSDEEGWIQLDDSESILTFDYLQLLGCGLAEEKIDSLTLLYKDHQFEDWTDQINKERKKKNGAAKKLSNDIHELWELMNDSSEIALPLENAYKNGNKNEYVRLYKKFRKAMAKMVIHAKNILKDFERGKYLFEVNENLLGKIVAVRFNGQNVLDDGMFEFVSIFRHFDEMVDAYNSYVVQ